MIYTILANILVTMINPYNYDLVVSSVFINNIDKTIQVYDLVKDGDKYMIISYYESGIYISEADNFCINQGLKMIENIEASSITDFNTVLMFLNKDKFIKYIAVMTRPYGGIKMSMEYKLSDGIVVGNYELEYILTEGIIRCSAGKVTSENGEEYLLNKISYISEMPELYMIKGLLISSHRIDIIKSNIKCNSYLEYRIMAKCSGCRWEVNNTIDIFPECRMVYIKDKLGNRYYNLPEKELEQLMLLIDQSISSSGIKELSSREFPGSPYCNIYLFEGEKVVSTYSGFSGWLYEQEISEMIINGQISGTRKLIDLLDFIYSL